jgi:hypothetical protein
MELQRQGVMKDMIGRFKEVTGLGEAVGLGMFYVTMLAFFLYAVLTVVESGTP